MNAWFKPTFWQRGLLAPIFVAVLCLAHAAHATPPPSKAETTQQADASQQQSMERLFEALQKLPGIEARFKEEKHLRLLALPIESEGVLYFHKDGYLLRKITKPSPSSIRITPEALFIDEDDKQQRVPLSSHQDVAHMVQSFLWILAGDLESLRAHFRMEFQAHDKTQTQGVPDHWTLKLHPTHTRVKKLLKSVTVRGSGVEVKEITVEESEGDRTVTTIESVNAAREFSEAEAKQFFGKAP